MPDVPSGQVLKNVGCPLWLDVLDESGNPVIERGKPKREMVPVRFRASHLVEMEQEWARRTYIVKADGIEREETFEGIEAWQEAMGRYPHETLVRTLEIVWGKPREEFQDRLANGEIQKYAASISAAWAIFNGVDPESAGKVLDSQWRLADQAIGMLRDQLLTQATEVDEALAEENSPGTSGSESGSKTQTPEDSEEALTSSGT